MKIRTNRACMFVPLPGKGPLPTTRLNAVCLDFLVLLDSVDAFVLVKRSCVDWWQLDGVTFNQAVLVLDFASQSFDGLLKLIRRAALFQGDDKCLVVFVCHFMCVFLVVFLLPASVLFYWGVGVQLMSQPPSCKQKRHFYRRKGGRSNSSSGRASGSPAAPAHEPSQQRLRQNPHSSAALRIGLVDNR